MNLICMAHKGEAKSFIQSNLNFIQIEKIFYLSKSKNCALLITGEGILEVLPKLSFYLGKYSEIKSITNLGIAGSLNDDISIGSIVNVENVLSYALTPPRRDIYQTDNNHFIDDIKQKINILTINCITTDHRILLENDAHSLCSLAHIVDREAWANARVASIFNKQFFCYKYISDRAGHTTKDLNFKQLSKSFSDALFNFYTTFLA